MEDKEQYLEYNNLNEYQKKCLSASNYWRMRNKQPLIKVPIEDTEYYKYFNKKITDK